MLTLRFFFISLIVLVGLTAPLQAQTCHGNPMNPPENWVCGTIPQAHCGSFDPDAMPMAIDATIVDVNGGNVETGDALDVTVPMVGMPDGGNETVYWRACMGLDLAFDSVLVMPFKGIPLGVDSGVEDKSTPTAVLVKAWWPSQPPAFMTSVTYRVRVIASAGTVVRLANAAIRLRINYLGLLRTQDRFTVGQPL
jgi:hypothetical protein